MSTYDRNFIMYKNRNSTLKVYAKEGDIVYHSGDAWSSVEEVKVDKENYPLVNTFWNVLYFNNIEDAEKANAKAKADYSEWMANNVEVN